MKAGPTGFASWPSSSVWPRRPVYISGLGPQAPETSLSRTPAPRLGTRVVRFTVCRCRECCHAHSCLTTCTFVREHQPPPSGGCRLVQKVGCLCDAVASDTPYASAVYYFTLDLDPGGGGGEILQVYTQQPAFCRKDTRVLKRPCMFPESEVVRNQWLC